MHVVRNVENNKLALKLGRFQSLTRVQAFPESSAGSFPEQRLLIESSVEVVLPSAT